LKKHNHKVGDLLYNPYHNGLGVIYKLQPFIEEGLHVIKYEVHYCNGFKKAIAGWAVEDYKNALFEKTGFKNE
jgi:hypothetical protein